MRNYSVVLVLFFGKLLLCSEPSQQRKSEKKHSQFSAQKNVFAHFVISKRIAG